MKRIAVTFCLFLIAAGAAAQPPVIGPNAEPARRGVWQILTPEQREQVWRSLTPEQKTDVWRALEPEERREMRERLVPPDPGAGSPWPARRPSEDTSSPRAMMTPEERQRMREQIREAHRLRRERLDAERGRPTE